MNVTNPNQEMTDFNYKKYSLENLENWLHDAITCGDVSPHEIYSTIRNVVQENYNIYKEKEQQCLGLLELLSGHRPVSLEEVLQEREYYEPSMPPWGHSDLEYMVHNSKKKDKVVKWVLSVEVDGLTGECYVNLPDDLLERAGLNEGDTVEWTDNGDGSFLMKKVND